MTPKKILHLSHTDIAYDSRILKEINSAKLDGYTVYAIGIKSKDIKEIGKRRLQESNNIESLKILFRKMPIMPIILKRIFIYIEFFCKASQKSIHFKPDIIHCNDTTALPIALMTKAITGSKLIYDAHELESARNGLSKTSGKFIKTFEKMVWRFIDGLIVVSPSISDWYLKNLGKKPTEVILNSPVMSSKSTTNETKQYLRNHFNISKDTKVFLYLGLLGQGRGIDLITEAFIDNSVKSHVIFMGYGPYFDNLKDLENKYSNIHVHEAVTHDSVIDIAQSADIGLCLIENISLSDYFCLPNKLFEYCFAGIPVLSSNFPDILNIIDTYKIGTVTDLDAFSIRSAIKSIENDEIKIKFSLADLEPLSWNEQTKKLLSLYKRVTNFKDN